MTSNRHWTWAAITAWGLLLCLPGCADGGVPFCFDEDGDAADVAESIDGGDVAPADADDAGDDDVTGDAPEDTAAEDAADDSDGGVVPGLDCQACTVDSDCAEGFPCVALPSGGSVCLRACNSEIPDCPPRFDCVESRITPLPDPVCAPVGERCCVDGDFDDYGSGVGCRGPDCDDYDPTIHPGVSESCNGLDDNCDGATDEGDPGGGLVCVTGLPGVCSSGVTTCEDSAVVCRSSASGTAETCDGIDNDCDGWVDEDEDLRSLTRSCYDGPAGTEGVGACLPGVQTCAGGTYRGCVGQIVPAAERCDGADENCDTVADDGDPGGGIACVAPVPGICAQGETACVGGAIACRSTIAPGSQPEICDSLDNDCDGVLNNGFPGLGSSCLGGVGACRRAGVLICNPGDPAGAPVCDVVPGTPAPAELCNYIDDDCDGTIDEDFLVGGVYVSDRNCGACGIDCTVIYAFPGAFGTCTVAGTTASCRLNCSPGFFNLNGIPGDGCEFSLDPDGVYVSGEDSTSADDGTCGLGPATTGGGRHACRTITFGISRATTLGRSRLVVADALYAESVALVAGVSLLGGYRTDTWERHLTTTLTTIRAPTGSGHRRTINAVGIAAATTVEGFVIDGATATTAGANSYAVYVNGGTSALTFASNTIHAGHGAPGATGAAGSDALGGLPGAAGANGFDTGSTACATSRAGASGGARTCGSTSVSGGAGGGVFCPVFWGATPGSSRAGSAGSGAGAGAGGAVAYDGQTRQAEACMTCYLPSGGQTMTGGNGGSGANGGNGSGGAGAASAVGGIAASEWAGTGGGSGGGAANGGGGGGGASGGGGDGLSGSCTDDLGATGGGGGSGACGGTAGAGGGAGGGSFGIFVVNTASPPTLTGNTIYRGFGGNGGNGGRGGAGGVGGAGASGGLKSTATASFCTGDGGHGGNGGNGGHGGGAGGGAGGVSYGIYVNGRTGYGAGTNTFSASGVGGAGGGGGPSIGTSGTAGAAGASANTN